jgi:hypothetical protein
MLTSFAFVAVATFPLLVGCQGSTVKGPGDKALKLTKPADQTLTQGDSNKVKVSINRDKFDDAVELRFENLPKGVKVEPEKDVKIAAKETSTEVTLVAEKDADVVSNHEVRVTASGPGDMKVTENFKLTVKDKK